jgi:hypothetical protein
MSQTKIPSLLIFEGVLAQSSRYAFLLSLELKLTQARIAKKPLLWIEVGAVRCHSATCQGAVGWCGQARVLRGAWVCVLFLKPFGLSGALNYLCVVLPRRGLCAKHR